MGASIFSYSAFSLWHDLSLYRLHEVALDIRQGRSVGNTELAKLLPEIIARDKESGLNSRDLDDAALVASLFADRMQSNPVSGPALLATAEHLLRERVALAPADGHSWLRLAFIRTARFGVDIVALDALRMSWLVTPREFAVLWPSLKFRVKHWRELNVQAQFAAADQVTGLWHKPPERAALKAYLGTLSPALRKDLLSRIVDPEVAADLPANN